jgi:hypothetical protein
VTSIGGEKRESGIACVRPARSFSPSGGGKIGGGSAEADEHVPNPRPIQSITVLRMGIELVRNLHRLACDTQAALFCDSEPPLRVAHMPLPKSSVARLSPSIILVNSKLCVRVAGV